MATPPGYHGRRQRFGELTDPTGDAREHRRRVGSSSLIGAQAAQQ